jgi:predicted RNA-binding Zn-ribbon protein involved in translation (DUF1610 family)
VAGGQRQAPRAEAGRLVSDLHRCPRCTGSAWWFDYEDKAVTAVCLMCAERVLIRDGRRAAIDAELAVVRAAGHLPHGPKPKGEGG